LGADLIGSRGFEPDAWEREAGSGLPIVCVFVDVYNRLLSRPHNQKTYRIANTDQERFEAAPRCPGHVMHKERSDQNIDAIGKIPAATFMLAIYEEMSS
jgi:hypothetical protein